MIKMGDIVDLNRYPLHEQGSPRWRKLIGQCQADLNRDGLFNLPGFIKAGAISSAVDEVKPVLDKASFNHQREHNIYFKKSIDGLASDHPALRRYKMANHTIAPIR